ncbi:MAG: hypothetical protein H0X62_02990 [Bacteroidetes bacterium]|nr:hypothetical protein [Bacteroidota bacterium]
MKTFVIYFLTALLPLVSHSQALDVEWSPKIPYDNKVDGNFVGILGINSKYIFTRFNDIAKDFEKMEKNVRLVSFDKQTMEKVNVVTVKDSKNKANSKEYKGLTFHNYFVSEDAVYLFWIKLTFFKTEIYAETFDNDLNRFKPLTLVYQNTADIKNFKQGAYLLIGNENNGGQLLLGTEMPGMEGENIKLSYKILKPDLTSDISGEVDLPIKITQRVVVNELSSVYTLGDDGNLHLRTKYALPKDDLKQQSKGEQDFYSAYSIINLKNRKVKSFPFKFEQKNIFDFDVKMTVNSAKVFGFFSDVSKDKKGKDTHGIFYSVINSEELEIEDVHFIYFSKEQLDRLFSDDMEDRQDQKLLVSKSKAESMDGALASNYTIEKVEVMDDGNIVIFCSRVKIKEEISANSDRHRTIYLYTTIKNNVTAFKISKEGKIEWASNLDRKVTYGGYKIADLKVIKDKSRLLVCYGNDYEMNTQSKDFLSKNTLSASRDFMEYALFDYETGAYIRKEFIINNKNTPKGERKGISQRRLQIRENSFYTSCWNGGYYIGRLSIKD